MDKENEMDRNRKQMEVDGESEKNIDRRQVYRLQETARDKYTHAMYVYISERWKEKKTGK